MPTLSASDYTTYLKFKAAAASPIRPAIQTRTNATVSQSVLNANLLASQAAFVTTPYVQRNVAQAAVVTGALTNILSGATSNGTVITYTSSQDHGLVNGETITVSGFTGNLLPTPNRTGVVTVVDGTTFTIPAVGASSGTATGSGSIAGRVYYTTNVAHGLTPGTKNVTIGGLSTSAFNLSLATVGVTPTTTTFTLLSTATGTAVSGATGGLTLTFFGNTNTSITNNARVQGIQEVQTRSTNKAKSTLSWTSGTSGSVGSTSSSKFQQPGGQPRKGTVGTYTRLPQNAGWVQGGAGNLSSGPKRF